MESLPAGEQAEQCRPWQSTFYACWIAQLFSHVGFSFVMPFIPFYIEELGVADQGQVAIWSGIVTMAMGLTMTVFSPIWGAVADRYGRKPMVERAMFGGAVILTLMGRARNVYELATLRFIQGALTGTVVATTALVSSISPRERLGYNLGLMQVAMLVGVALGPWLGGTVADQFGYRPPFYVAGAMLFLGGLVVLLFAHEGFRRPERAAGGNHGLRQAFGGRGMLAILSVFFFTRFSMSFVGPIFPLFVEEIAVGMPAATIAGMLMAVAGIASGLSAVIVGRVSDRVGHKRLLVASATVSSLLAAVHALVQSVGQLFGLRLTWGFATGGTSPAINALIGTSVSSDTYGRSYGISQSASALGMALGPLAGGLVASALGLRWPFVIMGGLLLMCAVLVQRFVRPSRSGAPAPAPPAPHTPTVIGK